jgi:hypothetical protein
MGDDLEARFGALMWGGGLSTADRDDPRRLVTRAGGVTGLAQSAGERLSNSAAEIAALDEQLQRVRLRRRWPRPSLSWPSRCSPERAAGRLRPAGRRPGGPARSQSGRLVLFLPAMPALRDLQLDICLVGGFGPRRVLGCLLREPAPLQLGFGLTGCFSLSASASDPCLVAAFAASSCARWAAMWRASAVAPADPAGSWLMLASADCCQAPASAWSLRAGIVVAQQRTCWPLPGGPSAAESSPWVIVRGRDGAEQRASQALHGD